MTNEEIEVKFLEVDTDTLVDILCKIGARYQGEFYYKHTSFDFADLRLDKAASWVNVRDEGEKVVMRYKKRLGANGLSDAGMEEVEFVVSSYEIACEFLKKIGLLPKYKQDYKTRKRYEYDGIVFDFDTIEGIPTYLEIESDSWEKITEGIHILGLDSKDQKICSANQICQHYGIDTKKYISNFNL